MHVLRGLFCLIWMSTFACAQKYAEMLMDADTGAILRQVDGDGLRYPASLTKMMTLYLTFEAIKAKKISLDTHFTVPSHAPPNTTAIKRILRPLIVRIADAAKFDPARRNHPVLMPSNPST